MAVMATTTDTPRLQLTGIRKVYGNLVANDDIDLSVRPGEIHAILGENGAGKSTLMKIIYGVVGATSGEMLWEGRPVAVAGPKHARSLGIGMVFQHFQLFETLTVLQNIALALPGRPDLRDLADRIDAVARRYGLPADPRRLVHTLSVGERQRVEIIRSLLQNPRLLIMDEPTSVLTPQAVRKLFETLRQLSDEGCSILYISHKLDEVQELCHNATVLRNGRVTGTCTPSRETPASMARLMIGKDLVPLRHETAAAPPTGAPKLRLRGLEQPALHPFGVALQGIDLEVHAGEIVGIAGVSGNGQEELLKAISGEAPLSHEARSMIEIESKPVAHLGSGARRARSLGFVPAERLGRGAVPALSLADNALLTAYRQGLVRHGLMQRAAIDRFASACIREFTVKCGGPQAPADSLSGGNLQKFIVGREVMQQPRVLVIAQPTWGVDVGAARFIRQSLIALREAGTALLVISEELDELFEICDRITVIAKGKLSPVVPIHETNVEMIGQWMSGLWQVDPAAAQPRKRGVSHVA